MSMEVVTEDLDGLAGVAVGIAVKREQRSRTLKKRSGVKVKNETHVAEETAVGTEMITSTGVLAIAPLIDASDLQVTPKRLRCRNRMQAHLLHLGIPSSLKNGSWLKQRSEKLRPRHTLTHKSMP